MLNIQGAINFVTSVLGQDIEPNQNFDVQKTLKTLKTDIESGKIQQFRNLRIPCSRAQNQMSWYTHTSARATWKSGQKAESLRFLRLSYHHLANAALWNGYGILAPGVLSDVRSNRTYVEKVLANRDFSSVSDQRVNELVAYVQGASDKIRAYNSAAMAAK